MPKLNNQKQANGSALDFEAQLWAAADKMRGHMDASEYKGARPEGLCLGLIFLKYISDAFEEKREQFYGQESNYTTWKLARMNLAILDFSLSASNGERVGVRCRVRSSPVNNANYAWIQYSHSALNAKGRAGFVMANSARIAHSCPMKITEDVRKYATEQSIAEEEALKKGMEEKSKEFAEKGSELYSQA